ncbi:unnamed protein product [Peronospora belbahrii]|uniref:Uncharacterized protein n=1 Tax=Peronospora belbahrii TaxID=622444 RepID=A0AAU9L588_9STRA|nr:unnamed protein product [Peronospora belbahrii]
MQRRGWIGTEVALAVGSLVIICVECVREISRQDALDFRGLALLVEVFVSSYVVVAALALTQFRHGTLAPNFEEPFTDADIVDSPNCVEITVYNLISRQSRFRENHRLPSGSVT